VSKKEQLLSFFCMTDKGNIRTLNEDIYLVDEKSGLWVLADGMGGYGSGDVASHLAVERISECVKQGDSLTDSIYSAHDTVLDAAEAGRGEWGMGTTVVALKVMKSDYEIAWVGDSRAYLLEDNQMFQITKDHSMVQEMVDNGEITQEQAEFHPQRNIISQAVGSPEINDILVDSVTGKLLVGNSILLCSDGLTTEVREPKIAGILQENISVEDKVRNLIDMALAAGGKDNVTVVIVEKKVGNGFSLKPKAIVRQIKQLLAGKNNSYFNSLIILFCAIVVVYWNEVSAFLHNIIFKGN